MADWCRAQARSRDDRPTDDVDAEAALRDAADWWIRGDGVVDPNPLAGEINLWDMDEGVVDTAEAARIVRDACARRRGKRFEKRSPK